MRRRHRHFNPGHAGAVLALDARFISGLNDGDAISTWSDRTSTANNATSSGTERPTYQTGELGGCPMVLFDGSNDRFSITNITNNESTILAVIRPITVTAYRAVIICNGIAIYSSSDPLNRWGTFVNNTTTTQSNLVTNTNYLIGISVQSTSNFDLIENGIAYNKTPGGAWPSRGSSAIGSAAGANVQYQYGYIAYISVAPVLQVAIRKRLEHAAAFSFKIPCS